MYREVNLGYDLSMKKLKAFFYIFTKSLSSLDYYKEMLKTPFSFSIKYLFMLALLASIVVAGVTSIKVFPELKKDAKDFLVVVKNIYPQGFEITVENGGWSINRPEPFAIPLPMPGKTEQVSGVNLIVFNKEGTIEEAENTMILVNKTNILFKNDNKFEVYALKNLNLPNGKFTQQNFDGVVSKFSGAIKYLPYVVIVFMFIGTLFYYSVAKVVHLLFIGLILWLFAAVARAKRPYLEVFRIGLHTITLPIILDVLVSLTNIRVPLPGWFAIINVLFGVLVLNSLIKVKAKAKSR